MAGSLWPRFQSWLAALSPQTRVVMAVTAAVLLGLMVGLIVVLSTPSKAVKTEVLGVKPISQPTLWTCSGMDAAAEAKWKAAGAGAAVLDPVPLGASLPGKQTLCEPPVLQQGPAAVANWCAQATQFKLPRVVKDAQGRLHCAPVATCNDAPVDPAVPSCLMPQWEDNVWGDVCVPYMDAYRCGGPGCHGLWDNDAGVCRYIRSDAVFTFSPTVVSTTGVGGVLELSPWPVDRLGPVPAVMRADLIYMGHETPSYQDLPVEMNKTTPDATGPAPGTERWQVTVTPPSPLLSGARYWCRLKWVLSNDKLLQKHDVLILIP